MMDRLRTCQHTARLLPLLGRTRWPRQPMHALGDRKAARKPLQVALLNL